jgi:LmbE family N-acetylglucosaminyl deacetylase
MNRSLALVMAHPDDEGYCSYGTVVLAAAHPGFRLSVLHATDGEAGEIAPDVATTKQGLGAWRREEDRAAWRALGCVPARHDWLGYPDGGLTDVPAAELTEAVATFLRAERPEVVITLPEHGVTGHSDHIAVCQATTAAFHEVRGDGGPGLRRLLYGGIPQSEFEKGQRFMEANGMPRWDPERVYHLRGTPDEHMGIVVHCKPVLEVKLAAMKEHRSQRRVLFVPHGTDELWMKVMKREPYEIAWPPRLPDDPVLDDVFAGLK